MESTQTSLWQNSDFLKFWSGQTISVFGSAITGLALPLTAVVMLDATPAQMGFLNAAGTLPFLLVGLFAGVWIDRSRRRPIMLAADLGRALLLGLIPIGLLAGILRIEFLYLIVFLVGVLTVFFDVSYQSFLPALARREHLVEGNSKMEVSFSAAQIVGPGIAGGLIQLLTAPFAIAVDAATFLVSALSLSLIRTREETPTTPPGHQPDMIREIKEGLQVVFGNRMLWAIAGSTGTFNLFSNVWNAILILYITRDLGLSPAQIGIVLAAGAPGALLASLTASRITRLVGLGPAIVYSPLISWFGSLLILAARGPVWLSMTMLILALFIMGFGVVVYNINQVSLRQTITPNRLLGRMNASMRFLVWGTIPLGALLSSLLSTLIGVRGAITVGVLGGLLGFFWVFFSPVRALKEQPLPPSDD